MSSMDMDTNRGGSALSLRAASGGVSPMAGFVPVAGMAGDQGAGTAGGPRRIERGGRSDSLIGGARSILSGLGRGGV